MLALGFGGWGWPFLLEVGVGQLCVVIITFFQKKKTFIIISEGGRLGLALRVEGRRFVLGVGLAVLSWVGVGPWR